MRLSRFHRAVALAFAAGLAASCTNPSAIKPTELLDERTGITVGELHKPLELLQSPENMPTGGKRLSFAYLGPVEWDNMGNARYGLWVHLAPGNDWRFDSIQMPGAVTLALDDGTIVLSIIDAPQLASVPYRPVASWGQTAYFDLSVPMLNRMAASGKIELDFKTVRDTSVRFTAGRDARESLARYLHARGY
jgi:hypothetical protein